MTIKEDKRKLTTNWKPVIEYIYIDGKSIPEERQEECLEQLRQVEAKYIDSKEYNVKKLVPFCSYCYAHGIMYRGGVLGLLQDHKQIEDLVGLRSNLRYTGESKNICDQMLDWKYLVEKVCPEIYI